MNERIVVVVPCYNEEKRLDVRAFEQFLARDADTDFIFVDDGSQDATLNVLEGVRARVPERVNVLALEQNAGKAEAVRQGVIEAMNRGGSVVAFWDADLATPLDAIPQFTQVMRMRPDISVVMGARVQLLGRAIERRPARHYIGRIFATVVSIVLGLRVYDTQCGAKMFRVTPRTRAAFDTPFRSRWIFDVELLARMLGRRGGSGGTSGTSSEVLELPLWAWNDVAGSKLRTKDFATAVPELAGIWWNELRPSVVRKRPAAERQERIS